MLEQVPQVFVAEPPEQAAASWRIPGELEVDERGCAVISHEQIGFLGEVVVHDAGAVLVAKLTLGALAWGDVWFGGTTKNRWNPEQGSSGSSAGSSAATSAGLVGFAIGTETRGSILSPCTRCGATGLRPTFGRVSRYGAMALSWSMDKVGPICRAVEDCALVLNAIKGPDGDDETVIDLPFSWNADRDPQDLRAVRGTLSQDRGSEGRLCRD